MVERDGIWVTLLWVAIAFSGLCVFLFWTKISVFLSERKEMKKAKHWASQSKV